MFASKLNKVVVKSMDTVEAYVDYVCDSKGCYKDCTSYCGAGNLGSYTAQYARHAAYYNAL